MLGPGILALAPSLLPAPADPGAADQGAIGAACRECHPRVVATYAATGMARALEPIGERDRALLGRLSGVREPETGYGYHFEVEGGVARVVETHGRNGPPAPVGAAELRLAIGAGLMDRSFAALRGGRWWLAPLEVLGGDGEQRRAVLAPAHEQVPGTRLDIAVGAACLRCHTDRLPPAAYPGNLDPGGDWTPQGISCGACHGDVEGHVRWQRTDPGERSSGDPVSVAWSMDRIARVSVCARCHLQGDARIPLTEAGADLPPPGEDLLAHLAVFGAPAGTDDIGFVSQVERLVQSRCFTATGDWGARALSCETCHDPHRSGFEPEARARVRSACGACHASAGSPAREAPACARPPEPAPGARDCVDCHMRRTPVFDLSGVLVHDHRIEARPPPPSSYDRIRAKQATAGIERFAWPGLRPPLDGDPGLELMAWLEFGLAGPGLERIDAEPAPAVARMPAYHHARGVLLEGRELDRRLRGLELDAGRMELARQAYARALELDPGRVETALRLVPVMAYLGRTGDALELIDGVVERWPRAPEPLRTRALVHLALGDPRAAAGDCEAAFELLPEAGLAATLAGLCDQLDQPERALAWRAAAARLDPAR